MMVALAPLAGGERPLVGPLQAWFHAHGSAVVCLSGGVDSGVLAATAHRSLGAKALAVTGVSQSLTDADRVAAAQLCRDLGLAQLEVATHELERGDYTANPPDRCYFCKSELFDRVRAALPAAFSDAVLVEGTHLADLAGHRPGHRAAGERQVRSPFVELGWSKAEIRMAAAQLGLPEPVRDRPSSPCLASRLPFGTPVLPARLAMVEQAEAELKRRGYTACRVRHHDLVARIELPIAEVVRFVREDGEAVATAFRAIGFVYTTVDVLGLRSGSLHEALRRSGPP